MNLNKMQGLQRDSSKTEENNAWYEWEMQQVIIKNSEILEAQDQWNF